MRPDSGVEVSATLAAFEVKRRAGKKPGSTVSVFSDFSSRLA